MHPILYFDQSKFVTEMCILQGREIISFLVIAKSNKNSTFIAHNDIRNKKKVLKHH